MTDTAVILVGGYGSRLGKITKKIPKNGDDSAWSNFQNGHDSVTADESKDTQIWEERFQVGDFDQFGVWNSVQYQAQSHGGNVDQKEKMAHERLA